MIRKKCTGPTFPHLYQCGCNRWVETGDQPVHLPHYASTDELQQVFIPAMREWLAADGQLPGALTRMDEGEVLEAIHYEYYAGIHAFVQDEGDRRWLESTSRKGGN